MRNSEPAVDINPSFIVLNEHPDIASIACSHFGLHHALRLLKPKLVLEAKHNLRFFSSKSNIIQNDNKTAEKRSYNIKK